MMVRETQDLEAFMHQEIISNSLGNGIVGLCSEKYFQQYVEVYKRYHRSKFIDSQNQNLQIPICSAKSS